MSNIQESIFKAIDVITDKKIGEIKFDKTIECIIENDAEADKGKYTARYQDIIINIFSNNNTVRYGHGTNVYVLVPQGDFSNKKTIIGKVENVGEEFISIDSILDKVETIGENYVAEPVVEPPFKLIPNGQDKETLRELAFKNEKFIRDYKNKTNLLIGGIIKTNLPKIKGDFGIYLDLAYKSGVNHQYRVSVDSMVGNPYSLNKQYQFKVFPLLIGEVEEVRGMYLYVSGFKPQSSDGEQYYVEFNNIEVSFAKPKEAEDLGQFSAKLKAEKGTVFKNGIIDNKETLTLEMITEKLGKPFTPNAKYKWFYSDLTVQQGVDGWDADGGDGWHLINPPKKEKEHQLTGMSLDEKEKVLTITPVAVPNIETFKCIAIFGGEKITFPDDTEQTMGVIKVEANETILDQSDPVNVVIFSTKGDVFKPSEGKQPTELICKVYSGLNESDPRKYLYSWGKKLANGNIQPIGTPLGTSEKLTIEDVNGIINTESYVCEVYVK